MSLRLVIVILSALLMSYSVAAKSEENSGISTPKSLPKEQSIKAEDQLERVEKQIEQDTKSLNERPKRKFIGARTKDYRLALYAETWRKKVEKAGNENYPKAAATEHLYGKVQVTVSIMADGTVETVEINKSSGHKILDDHVLYTIKRAAPYQPFDDSLKKDVDILSITRTWQYLNEPSINGAGNWFVVEVEEQI